MTAEAIVDDEVLAPAPGWVYRAARHTGLVTGASVILFMLMVALAAPLLAPYDPYAQDLLHRRVPPIWHAWLWHNARASELHWLGTDKLGRDYLSRLMFGARISLLIGTATMITSGLIGATLGLLAGYFRGRVDLVVMFVITTRLSLPVVLVALAVVSLHGSSLLLIITVLGLLLWDRFAVVMRSMTMQASSQDYVTAAQAIGCSTFHVLAREILPNLAHALIVVATLEMANAILLEAALSFLGLGVPSPLPAWGLMLAEGKEDMFFNPWLITIPGLTLFALVLAINLVGDGVRDISVAAQRR